MDEIRLFAYGEYKLGTSMWRFFSRFSLLLVIFRSNFRRDSFFITKTHHFGF